MSTKRTKGPQTGPGNQSQIRFNEAACSDKVSETGFNFFHGGGAGLLGDLTAAVAVPPLRPVYVFNANAAIRFAAFGASGLGVPADGAAGVPIASNTGIVLSSGDNTFIRASGAGVFAFVAEENIEAGPDQS